MTEECIINRDKAPENAAITKYPTSLRKDAFNLTDQQKINAIETKIHEIMEILGLDLSDESLKETPCRIARMYVQEIFSGLNPKNFPAVTLHTQNLELGEMILVKNISLISFCEHHFVPFEGQAHVAYLPQKHIIGLSKINRIVHYFSKRPQLQERLTAQIADSLATVLGTQDIAVCITARHYCVAARGVKDHLSQTTTHVFKGNFLEDPQRKLEFLSSINLP